MKALTTNFLHSPAPHQNLPLHLLPAWATVAEVKRLRFIFSRGRQVAKKRSNIYDIAEEAGVSIAMVSRVVNDSGPVAEAKRKKIQQILDKRGYQPSHAARALASNKTQAIGVVFREVTREYYQLVASQIIAGAANWCRNNHRYLTMVWGDADQIESSIKGIARQVDGLLFLDVAITPELEKLLKREKLPYALVNEPGGRLLVPSVLSDNRTGGMLAAEHLLDQGHEKIAVFGGVRGHHPSDDRAQGALAALERAGKPVADKWQIYVNFLPDEMRAAIQRLFAADADRPTAIIAPSDVTAVAAIRELRTLGLSVPADVAVVGYDNSLAARFADPPLTSIDQPFFDMGSRAASLLNDLIEGKADGSQVTLPVKLVERASVSQFAG